MKQAALILDVDYRFKNIPFDVFLERARNKFGDKYRYFKETYVSMTKPLKIECPEHGVFMQIGGEHLRTITGCYKCGKEVCKIYLNGPKSEEKYIEQAESVHGNKYDYSNTVYVGALDHIQAVCPVHGKFSIRAEHHLEGRGCSVCDKAAALKKRSDNFFEKALVIHGERYDYSKVVYVRTKDPVIIICKDHGEFMQAPINHLSGHGCPVCGEEGSQYASIKKKFVKNSKGRESSFYILKLLGGGESFLKIGITSVSIRSRFKKHRLPYEYVVLVEIKGSAGLIYDIEKAVKAGVSARYIPQKKFGGYSECYKEECLENICEIIKEKTQ